MGNNFWDVNKILTKEECTKKMSIEINKTMTFCICLTLSIYDLKTKSICMYFSYKNNDMWAYGDIVYDNNIQRLLRRAREDFNNWEQLPSAIKYMEDEIHKILNKMNEQDKEKLYNQFEDKAITKNLDYLTRMIEEEVKKEIGI